MTIKIIDMYRPITGLAWSEGVVACEVGKKGVISIEPYEEAGEMAMVLWFCVAFTGGIEARYNSKYIAGVLYEQSEKEK